jgi:hypothetical protein
MVITNMGVFLQSSIYFRKAAVNSYVAMGGRGDDSCMLFLGQQTTTSILGQGKKATGAKIGEQQGRCGVILIFFDTR